MRALDQITLITQKILKGEPLDDVLRLIVDEAVAFCRAERGYLILKNAAAKEPLEGLEIRVARGTLGDGNELPSRTALLKGLEGTGVLTTDNANVEEPFHKAPSVMRLKLKAILIAPVRGPDGPSGALYLDHRFQSLVFRDIDTQVLQLFADQAALALQKLGR